MLLEQKIKILSKLGDIFKSLSENKEWPGYELGINKEEYEAFNELVDKVHIYNGWFTSKSVREAMKGLATWLNEEELNIWLSSYKVNESNPKTIGVIMAGNIPLVGFNDFI